MKSAGETLDDRIREHAYHLWEAGGRPTDQDEEFWHRACEAVAGEVTSRVHPTQPSRKRSRRVSEQSHGGARVTLASGDKPID